MKNALFYFVAFTLFAGLAFLSCSKDESSDNGGAGADFDASLYYTRTEVDGLLQDVVQEDNLQEISISQAGYSNGGNLTVKSGSRSVLLRIFINSSNTNNIELWAGSSESSGTRVFEANVGNGNLTVPAFAIFNPSETIKVWQSQGNQLNNCTITVRPLAWFK